MGCIKNGDQGGANATFFWQSREAVRPGLDQKAALQDGCNEGKAMIARSLACKPHQGRFLHKKIDEVRLCDMVMRGIHLAGVDSENALIRGNCLDHQYDGRGLLGSCLKMQRAVF